MHPGGLPGGEGDRSRLRLACLAGVVSFAAAGIAGCPKKNPPPPPPPPGPDAGCDPSVSAQLRQFRQTCRYGPGSGADQTTAPTLDDCSARKLTDMPVQYVFVLMLENRSFDNYLGRFPAYLKDVLGRTDLRTRPYVDQGTPDGVDVPGTPYELRDYQGRCVQDARLDDSYDPRVDAPFNPSVAGADPPNAQSKHYWRHAKTDRDQCVSDTCHEWWCSHLEWDSGRMDGFFQANDAYHEGGEPVATSSALSGDRAMLYYDQTNIPLHYWLADQFAIADHYFSSLLGPTFPNRDYLYAATSRGLTSNYSQQYGGSIAVSDVFAGNVSANPLPISFNGKVVQTIYDALDAAGVPFTQWVRNRYSTLVPLGRYSAWYGLQLLLSSNKVPYDVQCGGGGLEPHVAGENARISSLLATQDPAAITAQGIAAGGLNPVNFIDPDSTEDVNGEDDHPPAVPQMGQRLVYDVVRILMANQEVWKRSVLFITYDEAGGFYDHVAPPPACKPDNLAPTWSGAYGGGAAAKDDTDTQFGGSFDRYGIRVPLIAVSPWVKRRYVSHYTYDHTSIDRFIEARFGLPALTRRDANAEPLFDLFDFANVASKLAGQATNVDGTVWGADVLPASLPNAPAEDPHNGSTAAAGDLEWYGGSAGEVFNTTANDACRIAMPAARQGLYGGPLGLTVYSGYDWSPGITPPTGYSPTVSQPFPLSQDGGSASCATTGAPPMISSVTPAAGPASGGTPVTLSGSNLFLITEADLGGIPIAGLAVSSDGRQVSGTTAAETAGTVDLVLKGDPGGDVTLSNAFTFEMPPLPRPTVTSVTPALGPASGGTVLTIGGSSLQNMTEADFCGAFLGQLTIDPDGGTQITGNAPPHAAGTVDIVLRGDPTGNVTVPSAFTYY